MKKQQKYHKKGHLLKLEILAYVKRIKEGDVVAERILTAKMERFRGYKKAVESALIGLELKQSRSERWARIRTSTINRGGVWPYRK